MHKKEDGCWFPQRFPRLKRVCFGCSNDCLTMSGHLKLVSTLYALKKTTSPKHRTSTSHQLLCSSHQHLRNSQLPKLFKHLQNTFENPTEILPKPFEHLKTTQEKNKNTYKTGPTKDLTKILSEKPHITFWTSHSPGAPRSSDSPPIASSTRCTPPPTTPATHRRRTWKRRRTWSRSAWWLVFGCPFRFFVFPSKQSSMSVWYFLWYSSFPRALLLDT